MKQLAAWAPFSVLFLLALCCAAQPGGNRSSAGPAEFVNPLIGSANSGNTFPGAVLPFGMVAFSPEEFRAHGKHNIPAGGYAYDANSVRGFSLTHLSGAGCAGGGDFIFMPITGEVKESPSLDVGDARYLSSFRHSQERAAAGDYRVRLQNGVLVELSATLRTGEALFTYPPGQAATLLIRSSDNETSSTDSNVAIDPAKRMVSGSLTSGGFCGSGGSRRYLSYYTIYFVAYFDQPFASYGTWKNATMRPGSLSSAGGTLPADAPLSLSGEAGKGSGAYVSFPEEAAQKGVYARVGISYVSEANAEANLNAESPRAVHFHAIRDRAFAAWNAALGRIEVEGGTPEQKTIFYTALYHSLLHMNLASDVNGQYRGMDQQTHRVTRPQAAQYANFSGWDVYRSQVQLVTLLFPAVASDMAQSLLNQAEQWGCWSRWTHNSGATNVMNGDPSAAAIAAITAFGGDNFDVERAYKSLVAAATVPSEQRGCSRPHLDQWLILHYLTASSNRHDTSVADTLELSTADFALSQLAARLDDREEEEQLLRRAQNWKNLFDPKATPQEGYLQARNPDGSWKPFDPAGGDGFVEGTGAQYLWMVPFNVHGLFALLGGDAQANRRLDRFFHDARGNWTFTSGGLHPGLDNEPCVGIPWLYDFSGEPYKTQQTVRAILERLWQDAPDGIPGNDDLGEMSSWYVWAALGMYPEIPGRSDLLLTSPLFPAAVIHRHVGSIRVEAHSRIPSAFYVQSMRVNGHLWPRPWLPAEFVRHGGSLAFTLSGMPNQKWGFSPADAPPSFAGR